MLQPTYIPTFVYIKKTEAKYKIDGSERFKKTMLSNSRDKNY